MQCTQAMRLNSWNELIIVVTSFVKILQDLTVLIALYNFEQSVILLILILELYRTCYLRQDWGPIGLRLKQRARTRLPPEGDFGPDKRANG
jgi:hypothetical protein